MAECFQHMDLLETCTRCFDILAKLVVQEGAQHWVDGKSSQLQVGRVKMGFHSLPSLQQLHLHVISQVFLTQDETERN